MTKRTNPVKTKGPALEYSRALRKVAAHVGELVRAFPDPSDPRLAEALLKYSEALDGWARVVAQKMLAAVAHRDIKAWREITKGMSLALRNEIENAPTGQAMRGLMADQVHLIKSLPLDAAQRVHNLVIQGQGSTRAAEIAKEIMRTSEVTKSRATLIALTETSRAATAMTQARAEHIGSEGYVWRTAKDSHVRESHKRMQGRFVRWDSPPTLDNMTGHAGCLPRCRCYPEVVIGE